MTRTSLLSLIAAGAIGLPMTATTAFGQWSLSGNAISTGDFLGTTNTEDLIFKVDNVDRILLSSSSSDIYLYGTANIIGAAIIAGPTTIGGTTTIGGAITIGGVAVVAGTTLLNNGCTVSGTNLDVTGGAKLVVSGGDADIAGGKLSILGGDLDVAGGAINVGGGPINVNLGNIYMNGGEIAVGYASNPGTYKVYVNGTTWSSGGFFFSDARFKEQVAPITSALDRVLALRGVTYEFRHDLTDMSFPAGAQVGFIAQEVEQVLPEVVVTNNDGYKGVAYQNMTAVLVEAMKEQQALIEKLTERIAQLERTIARTSGAEDRGTEQSEAIELAQNDPNPIDDVTTIAYRIPASVRSAEIVITEAATGREVHRFAIAGHGSGEVTLPVTDLAAGSYLYSIVADGRVARSRMMVIAR